MLKNAYNKRNFVLLWLILLAFPCISAAISIKSYSYDKYGNLQEITDPRGFVTQYQYDLLNRPEKIDYPDKKIVKYFSGIVVEEKDLVVDLDKAIEKSIEEQSLLRIKNSWLSDPNPKVSAIIFQDEICEEVEVREMQE